jgi:hypothetical protein
MTAEEVQPVMHALRDASIHIVALRNHMIDEGPVGLLPALLGERRPEDPGPRRAEGTGYTEIS